MFVKIIIRCYWWRECLPSLLTWNSDTLSVHVKSIFLSNCYLQLAFILGLLSFEALIATLYNWNLFFCILMLYVYDWQNWRRRFDWTKEFRDCIRVCKHETILLSSKDSHPFSPKYTQIPPTISLFHDSLNKFWRLWGQLRSVSVRLSVTIN